jgi:hypothetical protein
VQLVPNDSLAEVQLVLLQKRRVVPKVGVPAPDVEPATGLEHAGHVAEPGIEELVEFLIRDEVVGQRPILRTQFRRRGSLHALPCDIETLMMCEHRLTER